MTIPRPMLAAEKRTEQVAKAMAEFHAGVVGRVREAVERDPVVVVGMAQNPVVKAARKLLAEEGIAYTYLEYGSYLSKWKERLAIKLWAGFPTFPMVFVDGVLIGGYTDLVELDKSGELATMLAAKR